MVVARRLSPASAMEGNLIPVCALKLDKRGLACPRRESNSETQAPLISPPRMKSTLVKYKLPVPGSSHFLSRGSDISTSKGLQDE